MTTEVLTWAPILATEKKQAYYKQIMQQVAASRRQKTVYPPSDQTFQALELTPFEQVKVVILGQDPYHGPGQAHGLCFSVQPGVPEPPSLKNIKKELARDLAGPVFSGGCLTSWAEQGVLLLNSVLTVEAQQPQSHAKFGWQRFTDAVIGSLNQHPGSIVFMLWGGYAQRKTELITNPNHLILTAPHPSPLSAHRGYFGCRHFSQCNAFLEKKGRTAIDWLQ